MCVTLSEINKRIKRILVAADEGPTAEKIAFVAFELAEQLDAEIALPGVVDTSLLATDGGITPHELPEIIKNDLRRS